MNSFPKSVFFFALMLSSTFSHSQCCEYILSMHDTYGDGWNGGLLEVVINDVSVGTFSAAGFQSVNTIAVCNGDVLQLNYTPGDYENENSYILFDPGFNVVFSDGTDPQTGSVFSGVGNCDAEPALGHSPCLAHALNVGECVSGDNTGFETSGYNPNCAAFSGGDIWYALTVPPSGNISLATSDGGLTDTAIAAWSGNDCFSLNVFGCDDDGGPDYYSFLLLYDLTPGATIYIQVFGYGGGQGFFQLCANDLGTVAFDNSELPIVVIDTQEQAIQNDQKITALMGIKYNGDGNLTSVTDPSNVYDGFVGIEIRGATSATFPQPSFGFETRTATGANNSVPILNMPAENDWVLLSNFNDYSLIRNTFSFQLFGDMGHYSPRARLCEVMINDSYRGIYVLGEKIKRDNNRVDIATLDTDDNAGDSLTGGYILQQNYWDNNNSFQSNYSPLDHPTFDVHFRYEYPQADVITPQQKTYIASYMDSLETALYGVNFMDSATGYRNFLSVKSFIDYFIVNELSRNNDGFKKSVFYNKNKNTSGGKLKAGPVWDFDWGYKNLGSCDIFSNEDGSGWAHLINDCPTDNYSTGWYLRLMQDSTFANELRCTYEGYRTNILDTVNIFSYIDSMRALVQNAQARHFQKWPILGMSGFAPELDPIATSYDMELDKLKAWIALRLIWLDDNIPGLCSPVVNDVGKYVNADALKYYPNPSNGVIHFTGTLHSATPITMYVYDVSGKLVSSAALKSGRQQFDYIPEKSGVYYFTITNGVEVLQRGKLIAM